MTAGYRRPPRSDGEAARNVAASRLSAAVEEGRISEEKADRLLRLTEDPGALCDD